MDCLKSELSVLYGGKLRTRVMGVCLKDDKILMVKHKGMGHDDIFWAPPGGGMQYGTSAEENLIREFKEETGLQIKVEDFLFIHEFVSKPLHAVELFFKVEVVGGKLIKGKDPEMAADKQIIGDVKFMDWENLKSYKNNQLHNIFIYCSSPFEIFNLKGYFKFENNYIK
ncbi:MAG: NUDIX hydrolase [Bacteroidota bacterium]|nr:NUDIX hydrolase [Bacteroidota bacterium]